jgi:hypothetical protein
MRRSHVLSSAIQCPIQTSSDISTACAHDMPLFPVPSPVSAKCACAVRRPAYGLTSDHLLTFISRRWSETRCTSKLLSTHANWAAILDLHHYNDIAQRPRPSLSSHLPVGRKDFISPSSHTHHLMLYTVQDVLSLCRPRSTQIPDMYDTAQCPHPSRLTSAMNVRCRRLTRIDGVTSALGMP